MEWWKERKSIASVAVPLKAPVAVLLTKEGAAGREGTETQNKYFYTDHIRRNSPHEGLG